MEREAFTTVAAVKEWLGITTTETDKLIQRLIYTCTQGILGYINRDTFLYSERVYSSNGVGGPIIVLPSWPVHSINTLNIGGMEINPAETEMSAGYRIEPIETVPPGNMQELVLNGFGFTPGQQNIHVTFMAGYALLDERYNVGATVNVDGKFGEWVRDEGVKDAATGLPMVRVTATPAVGQYALGTEAGAYIFNAAQTGQVLISYSYVPFAIADACIEWVGERVKYRGRIGQKTASLSGQVTASYDLADMPDYIKNLLGSYRRVVPI